MGWVFSRVLLTVAAMLLGGGLGWLVGRTAHAPLLLAATGAALAVGWVALVEALRGERLMLWLRSPQAEGAPRDSGFWGELGYRFEKALRMRAQAVETERGRLSQFLAAIEASPNGVLLLDPQDRIEWCNTVCAEHFGFDPRRDRLQRVTNLVRAPAFVAYLQAGAFDEPIRFAAPTGRATLQVSVRPYAEGMKLVLSQDITEAERADAMRRDFVANVSHEIRTPLTVLSGFVETLSRLTLTEPERRRVLELMEQQARRMQDLVADLLTLAQLEGSPRPPNDQWLDVAPLLRRAADDAAALSVGRHDIVVQGGAGVQLAGNPGELASAVGNLMGNAIRYTPEGGRVELRWQLRDDGGGEFVVTDTGIGIAREHLPRLTERFYRVDSSRARDTGGTGLGLSIVKHVAQRHGGEIDIASEPGKGSTFRLALPALRVRAAPAGAPRPLPRSDAELEQPPA